MALNLSSLDLNALDTPVQAGGAPLQLSVDIVHEDPDQPRRTFNPDADAQLTESVRERGVKSPVSVRPHPTIPGHYILNYGARRLRASRAAGKQFVPAFVDELVDEFDQVEENHQREDLSPMEYGLFIQKKLSSGMKAADIARKLRKDKSWVTHHVALVDLPDSLADIYRAGKCQTAFYLYELRNLHRQFPDEVDAWCLEDHDFARRDVSALSKRLKEPPSPPPPATAGAAAQNPPATTNGAGAQASAAGDGKGLSAPGTADDEPGQGGGGVSAAAKSPSDAPASTEATTPGNSTKRPTPSKSALLARVKVKGQFGTLLTDRESETRGNVFLQMDHDGAVVEVAAKSCMLMGVWATTNN